MFYFKDDREEIKLDCKGGRTKQSFKDECDINTIMKRYRSHGTLPTMISKEPMYGDFTDVPSYLESLMIVKHAEEQFMALSADVRKKFNNDPAEMLDFCSNPNNKEELVKLGLALENVEPDIKPEVTE